MRGQHIVTPKARIRISRALQGHSLSEITRQRISKTLKALPQVTDRRGAKNPNWKGGRVFFQGLPYVSAPEITPNRKGYVLESRVIASKMIGRALTAKEVVHHRDGNPLNNTEENLLICSLSDHTKIHRRAQKLWVEIAS